MNVADLVGLDYEASGRCYGLVRTALSRAGVDLPECVAELMAAKSSYGRALAAGETPKAGDVVVMRGVDPEYELHLGVMVSDTRFLHATRQGSRLDQLSAWQAADQVVRVVRPLEVRA